MALTYVAIATVTVGSSGASTIDFQSIPNTYTDLLLKMSIRTSQANVYGTITMRLNTSTTSYSSREIVGTGSTAESTSRNVLQNGMYILNAVGNSATASTFGSHEIYIPNYAGSNNKPVSIDAVSENNNVEAYAALLAGLWSNTSAINQITIYPTSAGGVTISQYSTATLYGIKKD